MRWLLLALLLLAPPARAQTLVPGVTQTDAPGGMPCNLIDSGNNHANSMLCVQGRDSTTPERGAYMVNVNLLSTAAGGSWDRVALYGRTASESGNAGVWALNTVTNWLPRQPGQARPQTMAGYEIDLHNQDCDAGPNPSPGAACPTWSKGLWITGAPSYPATDAILIITADPERPMFHHGIRVLGSSVVGETLLDASRSGTVVRAENHHEWGIDLAGAVFSQAAVRLSAGQRICLQADCTASIRFDEASGAVLVQAANGQVAVKDGALSVTGLRVGGPARLDTCPGSADGLPSGTLWCDGTLVRRVP